MQGHGHTHLKGAEYVVFFDSDRQYIDCSEGVCRLVGYSRKEILKKRIDDLSYGLHRLSKLFATFLRQGNLNGEYVVRQSNGAPLPLTYRSYIFPDGCKGSAWEVITDWRAPYLIAMSGLAAETRELALDVAFAAIYQRLSGVQAPDPVSNHERTAIANALAELHNLRNQSGSFRNTERPGFDITGSALLRLADNDQDTQATEVLLQENRVLLAAALQKCFGSSYPDQTMLDLVHRVANKARYYDPEENPVVWLNTHLDMECRRLLREMKNR
jgi:PAS domain